MNIRIFIFGLAACLVNPLAFAGESGIYVGVAAGKSSINFNADDFYSPGPSNAYDRPTGTTDTSYKLFVGYHFDKTWAIEGGYANLGNFRFSSRNANGVDAVFDYSASSWTLAGKAVLPISERVSLFAKLGASANIAKNNYWLDRSSAIPLPVLGLLDRPGGFVISQPALVVLNSPGSQSKLTISPLLGLGIECAASKSMKIRLEYEDYGKFGDQTTTGRANATMTSLGVSRLF